MNDKITISTAELFRMFPDQETARTYLESRLWPNGCRCPVCGLGDRITARAGGDYSFENIRQAVARGSVVASFTCEEFSTRRLEGIGNAEVEERLEAFRKMTAW